MARGLQSYWYELIRILNSIVSVYEKVNYAMSLFTLRKIRLNTARILGRIDGVILDAGCGPGTMIPYIMKENKNISYYLCLDPLPAMLRQIDAKNEKIDRIRGVFEHMPLRKNSLNACLTSFSFRDSYNYVRAFHNIYYILRNHGIYVMIDLYKSTHRIITIFVKLYLSIVPRILGSLLLGANGFRLYRGLYLTYEKFLNTDEIMVLARIIGFKRVFIHPLYRVSLLSVFIK